MTIRTILKMGTPSLLERSQEIDPATILSPEIQSIIQDLQETMVFANGAGLAAPQIGINLQIVIFGFEKSVRYPDAPAVPNTVLINPVITPLSQILEDGWEGCLSVPGLRGVVPRYQQIRYQGRNGNGEMIDRQVDGFHARVVQHECDHLWGTLYPMRIKDLSQFGFTEALFPELSNVM